MPLSAHDVVIIKANQTIIEKAAMNFVPVSGKELLQ